MMHQTEIIFSIPGRIRIKISDLFMNEKTACSICSTIEDMQGVISARSNTRTGNILVCYKLELTNESEIINRIHNYENDMIPVGTDESFIKSLKKVFHSRMFSKKNNDAPASHNEYRLSRRFLKAALIIGGIVFLFEWMISRLIAILIFACPAILFVIPVTAFYYGMKRSRSRRIYMKDYTSLARLRNIGTVYLNDSVFMSGSSHDNKDHQFKNQYHSEIQKLIEINNINHLLNIKITDFVFGIRENGITDIAIVTDQDDQAIEKIAYILGIEKIYRLKDNITRLDFYNQHTLIVTAEELTHGVRELSMGVVLYIYNKNGYDIKQSDISVNSQDIDKIPWMVGLSRYCKEIIIRSQNSAIAINSLGILFASLGFLNPLGAISVYGINTVWQILFIKNRILSYKKDNKYL